MPTTHTHMICYAGETGLNEKKRKQAHEKKRPVWKQYMWCMCVGEKNHRIKTTPKHSSTRKINWIVMFALFAG